MLTGVAKANINILLKLTNVRRVAKKDCNLIINVGQIYWKKDVYSGYETLLTWLRKANGSTLLCFFLLGLLQRRLDLIALPEEGEPPLSDSEFFFFQRP